MSGIHMEQTEAQSSWPNTLTSFMVKFQSYMVITFALAVDNHACLISLNAFLLNLSGRGWQQGEMQTTYPRSLLLLFFFVLHFCLFTWCRCACAAERMWRSEDNLWQLSSLLPSRGSQALILGGQVWWQAPWPATEPSLGPLSLLFKNGMDDTVLVGWRGTWCP